MAKIEKPEEEWRRVLTPEAYAVTREKGTERPFTGKYWDHHGDGAYACVGCGKELFASAAKFESGSGWPSFTTPLAAEDGEPVEVERDVSHGMVRSEVHCADCGAHLGHVFPDGPPDQGGLRYCINSASLVFKQKP